MLQQAMDNCGFGQGQGDQEEHGQDAHDTLDAHATYGAHTSEEQELIIRYGDHLPHWTRTGATYAVTFRLHDSMPKDVLEKWIFERERIVRVARKQGRELTVLEQAQLKKLYSDKIDQYLDAGHGACYMRKPEVAQVVAGALQHFDGTRYALDAWCVMPNHVHCVMRPIEPNSLPGILHSWKSFTAKQANRLLQRKGSFWQEEYYDHLIRDEREYLRCLDYVLNNPVSAGLDPWEWVGCSSK